MTSNNNIKRDINNIIEHVTATIVTVEREEAFYRRSAAASTNRDISSIMLDIAEDLARNGKRLEAQRDRLQRVGSEFD